MAYYVESGQVSSGIILDNDWMDVSSGGTANSTTVNADGTLYVQYGGTANSTTVNSGGTLYVQYGGTATDIIWTPFIGSVIATDGGTATFADSVTGIYLGNNGKLLSSAQVMSGKTVSSGYGMYIMSGGTATNTSTGKGDSDIFIEVWSGGRAYNTTLYDGEMRVMSGGLVSGVMVYDDQLRVSSGGTALAVVVASKGDMEIQKGGTVIGATINSGGKVDINDASASVSDLKIQAGGRVMGFTLQKEVLLQTASFHLSNVIVYDEGYLAAGQSVDGVTVKSGGNLYYYLDNDPGSITNVTVEKGGSICGFTLGSGTVHVDDAAKLYNVTAAKYSSEVGRGVTVTNVTILPRVSVSVGNGGKLAGEIRIEPDNSDPSWPRIWCNPGAIIDFTVSGRTTEDDYLINDVSRISNPTYTITVDANQAEGIYKLAEAGWGSNYYWYDQTDEIPFFIGETQYGTLTVNGDAVVHGSQIFTLETSGDSLLLFVEQLAGVLSVSADITSPTNGNVTISATFSSKAAVREYSLNGWNWSGYTGGVVMNDNGTVYFRAGDGNGYYSDAVSYTVSNIDRTAPDMPTVNAANSGYKVLVTAAFSDDSAQKQYSLDNQNWNNYDSGVLMGANGTVYFRGIDAAGNISDTVSYIVDNIEIPENVYIVTNADNGKLDLAYSGKYTLTGEFGDIDGSVSVLNGGKKAGTGTIKKGVLAFNRGNPILLDNSLATEVQVAVKKGTDTDYTAVLSAEKVFDQGDTDSLSQPRDLGLIAEPGKTLVSDGWVGFGDEFDYLAFSLDHAASLRLDLTSTDAAKFTLINAATGKSVLSSSLKTGAALTTNAKLLEAGQYYLQVQSTNAKKGGDANYTVSVNQGTAFFTQGGDNNDSWQTAEPAGDLQIGAKIGSGWVGFGDEYDFSSVTLNSSARLKFTVNSSDAVKFTVYQVNDGKLKSLGNASVKTNASGTTKDIFVTAGTYYLSVQSTNAKKGGHADYSVTLDGSSKLFPAGDDTNDTWQAASQKTAKLPGEEITGWVGFGDAKDFIRFQLNGDGQIELDLDSATAGAYSAKQIKLTCLDANGKSVGLGVLDDDTLVSKKAVAAGEYYLGVTCANVKKFDTSYSVTTGLLATA